MTTIPSGEPSQIRYETSAASHSSVYIAMGIVALGDLPDDILARIVNIAFRPVHWPHERTVLCISHRFETLCRTRRVRCWFFEFSTLARQTRP